MKEINIRKYPIGTITFHNNDNSILNTTNIVDCVVMSEDYFNDLVAPPQPSDILSVLNKNFKSKEIKDEFGFIGEWSLSVKDIIDLFLCINENISQKEK